MNCSIEKHIIKHKKYLKGKWVKRNSGYDKAICKVLSMIPRKSRYWDAEWQGKLYEFKKGKSVWLNLVRYSEIILRTTTEATKPTTTLFFVPNPNRYKIQEIIIVETKHLIKRLKLNKKVASSLTSLSKYVPRQLNAQANLTLKDIREIAKAII